METSTILFSVALVVLIYVIFIFTTSSSLITDKIDLAKSNPDLPADKLSNPGSTTYSYELWIYVYAPKENIGTANAKKYIFSRVSADSNNNKNIGLYLDGSNAPSLHLEYTNNTPTAAGADSRGTLKTVPITDNFPMQSWVHVIISVQSGKYIDMYVNGKLTKSIKDDKIDTPSLTSPIVYGQLGAYLAKFLHTTDATDPQTAWSNYLSGNGENGLKQYVGGKYEMKFNFKNGDNKYEVNLL